MDPEKIIEREDSLGNWRTATLLAFNGFLFDFISEGPKDGSHEMFWTVSIPLFGFALSGSVLWCSIISCNVKFAAIKMCWNKHHEIQGYKIKQFFGPYILSGLLMTLFWVSYITIKLISACS